MNYSTATFLCALLLLSACSPSDSNKAPVPKLFAEERDALDKAKTANVDQQKHDEEQKKAIEEQTK